MAAALTAMITRRLDPCGCGCGGDDPWHAREFSRVLHEVKEEEGRIKVHAYSAPVAYRRTALARLPWGEGKMVKVVEVVFAGVPAGWFTTAEVVG